MNVYVETPTRHTANWGLQYPPLLVKKLERSLKVISHYNDDFFKLTFDLKHTVNLWS